MSAHCEKCDADLWQDTEGNFICPVCTKDIRIQELEAEVERLKYNLKIAEAVLAPITSMAESKLNYQERSEKLESLVRELDKDLSIYPQFSEKYADVKYSENCFREMVSKAKDRLAHAKKILGEK
jgi:uncharacterized Zn finger protein (UPF0148 family)